MNKVFNPNDWLVADSKSPTSKTLPTTTRVDSDLDSGVDLLVRKIEAMNFDITSGYENWRNIAFSLAESLGESGRNYFHRISRLNPDYNREKCDKQYTNCLKCRGGGITIASLFWIAKTHGVIIKNRI
ncbi:PriCT-2 domain-containing protein [Labilibaculum euxinus]